MMLSWLQIFRMGLVQMCLGAVVVLTTSTLNRLMVVELALPAVLPGLLVALHYGIQITRPNWGYLSDTSGHRTRWIIGGMAVLASGGYLAALAVVIMETQFGLGLALSILAYALIGVGVGASGTSLLALLATATAPRRRAAAATITWLMMIGGIAVTATVVGGFLDPYSPALLLEIVGVLAVGAVVLTALAIYGIEARVGAQPARADSPMRFREGLAEIWGEREARLFTIFVFLSMTAYFMQELILEPYAGLVFHFTPGQSTQLSGAQNGGVFLGMLTVGVAATGLRLGSIRHWVVAGCLGSASALAAIALLGASGTAAALVPIVVVLGFFNGMFAVGAIGAMMALAGQGREAREGTRMGLWGAAQAMAAGFGGLMGAAS
ncbi:MAG: BCD family MFS transporter, partial [Roseovarius sp.]|nr:BCD family MFS transporter [Roseovarius sp.]